MDVEEVDVARNDMEKVVGIMGEWEDFSALD